MNTGRVPYRQLTPAEREATLDASPDLLDAALDARHEGRRRWELGEVIFSQARALGVACWPALAERLRSEAWPTWQW